MERKTICRDGLGCVLVNGSYDPDQITYSPRRNLSDTGLAFPYGNNGKKDSVFEAIDYARLDRAIDSAFSRSETQKTRSVLVVYKNHIVAERYEDGISTETPVLGWSMTKSIWATLYGILAFQGKIDLQKPPDIPEWQLDDRKRITIDHLLRMQSGLAWDEDYTKISDVTRMLFLDSDMTTAQRRKKVIAAPTELWNYSSGTTNLLSGLLRKRFDTHQAYLDFPYAALIDKIGMHSMLIETDMAGNYVGSSYRWATTRDWAKFGLLYLNKGNWNGEQLFDELWITYITRPTTHSNGTYGAHFWVNTRENIPMFPKTYTPPMGIKANFCL